MELLSKEFLKSKLATYNHPHYGEVQYKCGSGNIHKISDYVYCFTVHNLLPGNDGQLDGHYEFYVNVTNFKYLLYKASGYGSLTYTTPSDNVQWVENLIERELIKVESIIASKILGAYYQDGNAVNRNGQNLISNGKNEPAGSGWNDGMIRWTDGYKTSLICDNRGYIWSGLKPEQRSQKEIEAISLLEPEYRIRKVKSYKLGRIRDKQILKEIHTYTPTTKKGKPMKPKSYTLNNVRYLLPIDLIYTDKTKETIFLARELTGNYYKNYIFLDKDMKPMQQYSNHHNRLSEVVKMVPKFIESL